MKKISSGKVREIYEVDDDKREAYLKTGNQNIATTLQTK